MAEKEIKNAPKDLVEPVPEEVSKLESDPEVKEELEELERVSEESEEEKEAPKQEESKDTGRGKRRSREEREQEEREKALSNWAPKTALGKYVLSGEQKSLSSVIKSGKKILEPEVVDTLINLESDLIAIGQAKGKFGGGKRRAWRQTQKKTKEGNILTFSSMAVVGNSKGFVGVGYGRAKETLPAREKALRQAKLNIIEVSRGFETPEEGDHEPHTVPFKVNGKSGSVRITLLPAPRGTGLVIGDEGKKILKLAGIKDVYAVSSGHTRTTFNLAKACIDALKKTSLQNKEASK